MSKFIEDISLLGTALILISILLGWLIIRVSESESNLNKRLDDLEKRAKLAKTIEELELLRDDVIALEKETWHKLHGTQLNMIKTTIKVKHELYQAKRNEFNFDI